MNIIQAQPCHLDQITTLAMKLWPNYTETDLKADFKLLLNSANDIFYLAMIEDAGVGFIHVSLRHDYVEGSDSSPVGYIEGIYVDESFRKQGISTRLVEAGERWAVSMGCKQMASDTELDNVDSQQFHTRIGFKEANRIVAFIKELD